MVDNRAAAHTIDHNDFLSSQITQPVEVIALSAHFCFLSGRDSRGVSGMHARPPVASCGGGERQGEGFRVIL